MGRTEKRELISRLTVLLTHLLKWSYQPKRTGSSWRTSVKVQRRGHSRSLTGQSKPEAAYCPMRWRAHIGDAIEDARRPSFSERADSSARLPWSFDEIMNPDFWPE